MPESLPNAPEASNQMPPQPPQENNTNLAPQPIQSEPGSPTSKKNPIILIALGAVLFLVIGAGIWYFTKPKNSPNNPAASENKGSYSLDTTGLTEANDASERRLLKSYLYGKGSSAGRVNVWKQTIDDLGGDRSSAADNANITLFEDPSLGYYKWSSDPSEATVPGSQYPGARLTASNPGTKPTVVYLSAVAKDDSVITIQVLYYAGTESEPTAKRVLDSFKIN